MLSYRKLAMRVLNRPLHVKEGISPRPAAHRAAALALTAAMLTTLTAPAFAGTWYIEDGDITISAGEDGNDVTQNETTTRGDKDTVVKNRDKDTASSNTVTINAEKEDDTVDVTLEDVNIDTSKTGEAAVSVTGKGDTTIELDGDNVLKSGSGHAGLEHNKTEDSGSLTIQDEDENGSLDAAGGYKGAGIGGGSSNDGQVTIAGGDITAAAGASSNHGGGAGIGGGDDGDGYVEITGGNVNATGDSLGSGIGGGCKGSSNVTISGGTITATGGNSAAGIGGGFYEDATVTITGDAVIKNASSAGSGAGIGGGMGGDGDVTISGNAKIENAAGVGGAAGIGGGVLGNGTVRINDNAEIDTAVGGDGAAGIGGGVLGIGDVTIEGNVTIKNAQGGINAAGIGGGAEAKPDDDGRGNQITIKSSETGSPNVTATGGSSDKNLPGGAGIGTGCNSSADTDITIEGKVTVKATAGEDNAAIGANGVEQEFPGLAEGTFIIRYDSEGNDISLPGDKGPITEISSGGSAAPSAPASTLPGLTVTDKNGAAISYISTQSGNTLVIRAGRFTASLHTPLSVLRQLRAEGIENITFQTILHSTTLSVDELLALGGEDTEAVLIHRLTTSSLTVG